MILKHNCTSMTTIQKSRGYSWENEVCNKLKQKHKSIRLGQPNQPDVLLKTYTQWGVIECKSTIHNRVVISPKQYAMLEQWCDLFDAKLFIAVKFGKNGIKDTRKVIKRLYSAEIIRKDKSIVIWRDNTIHNCVTRNYDHLLDVE